MLESMKALKLDASYRPVGLIDAVEALVLCIVGKAKAIENYSKEIRSPSNTFKIPAVIVLKTIVKYRFTGIVCNRQNVIWRDKSICQYCGNKFLIESLTVDHLIPKSRGGANTWTNLVAACKKCNQKKGCRTPQECGMIPINKPVKPNATILKTTTKINELWKNYLWEQK
jgi:5-methylcytosine-specific restriction endonuclease McrA|tara:strand:- start:683 stop:1192 length:510 start_codon:yes stop_codon:yes gene_type:complete